MLNKFFLRSVRLLWSAIMMNQILETKCCTFFNPMTTENTGATFVSSLIDQNTNFCFGIWFMYQALSGKCSKQDDNENFQILSITNMIDGNLFLAFFLSTNKTNQLYNPSFVVNSGVNLYFWKFDIANTEIESRWHYMHSCFDIHYSPIPIYMFFDQTESAQMKQGSIPKIIFQNKLKIQIGGSINLINPQFENGMKELASFSGKIGNVQVLNSNINILKTLPDYLSYLSSNSLCQPTVSCNDQVSSYLIENVQQFYGDKILQFQKQYINGKYTIEGWGKVNVLDQELTQNMVQLLRVSVCSSFQDDQNLGDRIFLLRYILNRTPEQNGIYVATYNINSPVQTYQTTPDDEWTDLNAYYEDAFYEWHYLQFQHGINDVDYNTQIQIFFKKEYKTINHNFYSRTQATESSLYFSVGGDNFMGGNLMQGYVANLKLTYCNTVDVPFQKQCHYSCLDCDGPTENDCILCPNYATSKRLLFKSTSNGGQCDCDIGFINKGESQECQSKIDEFNYFSIVEITNEDLTCEYSHFLVRGKYKQFCLKWQSIKIFSPGIILENGFYCADCITKPKTWYLNPICTYDYILYDFKTNQVYEERQRLMINYDYFIINEQQEILEICLGCKGITKTSNYFLTTISKTVQIECKQCYKFDGQQCIKVIDNCNQCDSNNQCTECADGFTYDSNTKLCLECPKICPECQYTSGIFQCLSCPDRYALVEGDCIQCGINCQLCALSTASTSTFVKCYKCIDINKYYLSLDQKNCYKNEIANCLIAVQQEKGDITKFLHNSFDVFYSPVPLDQNIKTFCALCQQGFTNYFHLAKCQNRSSPYIESIVLDSSKEDEIFPLKSADPKVDSFIKYDQSCKTQNCLWCISNYFNNFEYCQECKAGYYAHTVSGFCIKCPANLNCRTCQNQYVKAKDSWKWDIRGYYHKVLNTPDNYHQYIALAQPLDITQYEVICSTCPPGYDLYQQKCIVSCPLTCKTCKIIDFKNICIECPATIQGQIQVTINNNCIKCPNQCAFCRPQESVDLKALNLYFSPDYADLNYFSNICLKQYPGLSYYYDTNLGLFVDCYVWPCSKQVVFYLNVYCDSDQYDTLLQSYENDQINYIKMKQKNIKITDLFSTDDDTHFKNLESLDLYTELSNNVVKSALFKLTFIYNNKKCTVPNNGFLISKLRNNIYSLRQMDLEINGDINQDFEIINSLSIFGFNTIKFSNVKFKSTTQSQLLTIGYTEQIYVQFDTITITGDQTKKFQIIIQNPRSFSLKNFQLSSLNIVNEGSLFNFIYNITDIVEIDMTMEQLTITESEFHATQLFDLPSNILKQSILISSLTIGPNVVLNDSKIFNVFNQISQQTIDIKQISISKSVIYKTNLFDLQGFSTIILKDIGISENKIEQTNLFLFSRFSIENCQIINNQLISSRLFTNEGKSFTTNIQQNYEIVNFNLQFNTYTSEKTFFCIIQLFTIQNITIDTLNLINNKLSINQDNQNVQITAEQSNFHIIGNNIVLKNIIIIRYAGYPEFTLLNSNNIDISNLDAKIDPDHYLQVLHSSITCVSQLITETQFSSIFFIFNNQQITLDQINLYMLITLNQPIIMIISEEAVIEKRQESITITNSKFQNITLLQTGVAVQQSIILILSGQNQQILMENLLFESNHQNSYVNDISYKSSATVFINSPHSQIQLLKSLINQNLVTNSINSVLIIKADKLTISNCYFNNNNQYNFEIIRKYFLWGFDASTIVYYEDFALTYQVKSNGGSGQFSINQIIIEDSIIYSSQAQKGGGFYLETSGEGLIDISNSTFKQCSTTMYSHQVSQGGSLYIESSQSNLKLVITNTKFINTYSRTEGGAIYINPSLTQTQISLSNIDVRESHSLLSSFFRIAESSSSNQIVTIDRIAIQNSFSGYLGYLAKIQSITQSEVDHQFNNYIFTIDQGYFSLNQLSVSSCGYGIFYSQNIINARISNSKITNIQLIVQQLFDIKLNYLIQSQLTLDNIEISHISIYNEDSKLSSCQYFEIKTLQSQCLSYQEKELTFLYYRTNSSYENDIGHCHLNLISQQTNYEQSIILINQLQKQQLVYLNQLVLYKINCSTCVGLIKIINIVQTTDKILEFSMKNTNMSENVCGQVSCILILQSTVEVGLSKIKLNRILEESPNITSLNIASINSVNYSAVIENSQFYKNQANSFGVVLIDSIQTLINECTFLENSAHYLGGALTFFGNNTEILGLYNSLISQNKAKAGGGLYIDKYMITSQNTLNNIFFNNDAETYGLDRAESPYQLTLSVNQIYLEKKQLVNTISEVTDLILINPYKIIGETLKVQYLMVPSGQQISSYQYLDEVNGYYIPYNLSFRIIPLNQDGERIKNLTNSKCYIRGRLIDISNKLPINSFTSNYTNPILVVFNDSSQDYNLDYLIVKFDPNLNTQYVLQLAFSCDSIQIPIFQTTPPYLLTSYHQNYTLLVNVQTFQCQRGEQKFSGEGTCIQCESSSDQYTVEKGGVCQIKDSTTMEAVRSAQIKLRPGYWRAYISSEKVELCLNLLVNCEGGWKPGDTSCYVGHIGALCEQCDLYNIRGEGAYSTSTMYKCGSCNNVGDNTIKIILISIWTIISIFMSVRGSVDSIETLIKTLRLQKLGIAAVSPKSGYDAILIKVITNYFQIVGTITTFQLQIPSAINSTFSSVGSPIETMSYSIDCLLISLSDINIMYFRMIWSLIMPFIYLSGFFVLYGVAILVGVAKRNLSVLTTAFIYMYIFMQPTLIGGFISLLSFRQIGGMYWVQGNVSYIYNTSQHFRWLTTFVMPSLLILGCIIPLILYIQLYKIKNNLDTVESRKKLGYLYNEYRKETYYWEIIKILQKGLIITMLTFYQDLIVIKAALIFIIVFLYQLLTKTKLPYKFIQLNNIDNQSTIVCGTSIVLAMTIYSATKSNNTEIVWPFYILLIILNGYFCLSLIIEFLEAQIDKNMEVIDKIRDKINAIFPKLQTKNKFFKLMLENSQVRKQRIKKRYKILKSYLLGIVRNKITFGQTIFDSKQEERLVTDELLNEQHIKSCRTKIIPSTTKVYPELCRILINKNNKRVSIESSISKSTWLRFQSKNKDRFDD